MAITLGSNIASLQSQRRLFDTSEKLATVFERLASGQRINRASDDAAGLAISESLNADRRVFSQAIRNLNDGQSALNIADSTVEELSSIVIRIQELATQSANGSLSNQQRESLDIEAQELRDEFFRVSREAEFNGLKLFDGTLGNGLRLQGGYGEDGGILSSIGEFLGTGEFASSGSSGTATGGNATESVLIDVDGDGNLDLISGTTSLTINFGNGDGTFGESTETSLFWGTGGIRDISTGDFNGDGLVDLVVTEGNGSNRLGNVLLNQGDGSFSIGGTYRFESNSDDYQVGDINGDGVLDILSANGSSPGFRVYIGGGDGSFDEAVGQYGSGANVIESFVVADFDGDGVADIVANEDGGKVLLLEYDQDGNLLNDTTLASETSGGSDIEVADLNGDDNLDIVVNAVATGDLTVRLFDSDQNISSTQSFSIGGQPSDLELADLNGDGSLEIVSGQRTGGNILVFSNNGEGSFSITQTLTGVNQNFELGDLNNDGVLDLIDTGGSTETRLGLTRTGVQPLLEFSLATQSDAMQALSPLENKLRTLTEQRGVIGAFQSRLETAVNTLQATTENYAAAESRIRDADIANESANLTRLNILRQAASSVLAQANQQPALSLQLLS